MGNIGNFRKVRETLGFHGVSHSDTAKVEAALKDHGKDGVEGVMEHLRGQSEDRISDHHLNVVEEAFRKHTPDDAE